MRFLFAAAAMAGLLFLGPAFAHEVVEGDVKIDHPRAAPTPPGAKVAAAWLTIVNRGKTPLRLTGISSEVSDKVEVHSVTMDNGVMRMRHVALPLEVAPGATLDLKTGHHLMLTGLKRPLVDEEMVGFTLEFADGKKMAVDFYVEASEGGAHKTPGH